MTQTLQDLVAEADARGLSVVMPDGSVLGAKPQDPPGLWVRFTPQGIPGWFGPEPVEGAEFVTAVPLETLITHRRDEAGAWVPRTPVKPEEPTEAKREAARQAALAEAKLQALARVTAAVQSVRLRLITPLAGQDAIYTEKQAEAVRYLSTSPEPATLDAFPFLRAEVGITAPSARDLAQVWLNMAHLFALVGSATEGARKATEAALAVARDEEAVAQAEAAFSAALAALALPGG